MGAEKLKYYTEDEYFALENSTELKYEYFDGGITAMAGGMPNHNRIIRNATVVIDANLRNGPCELFPSEQRIQVIAAGIYTYPDLSVFCDEPILASGRNDTFTNPRLLIEVLSESTEDYDRGQKFVRYRLIPSLQEYVMISSEKMNVEVHRKINAFHWEMKEYTLPQAVISLKSIQADLMVQDLYRDVVFTKDQSF